MALKPKVLFIVYHADDEVLITTPALEKAMRQKWFSVVKSPCREARNPEHYIRKEIDEVAVFVASQGLRVEV